MNRLIALLMALAVLASAGLAMAAPPKPKPKPQPAACPVTPPPITGVVKMVHKDAKGALAAFTVQAKDKAGKPINIKVAVTKGTRYKVGADPATAGFVQVRSYVTVEPVAAAKDGKATARLVRISPPHKPAPATVSTPPPTTGG